ncbi:hypothetical protein HNQ79_002517 [Streptomyces candidus]|uniref:Uncharacterized protein n=1 Tax=Streptomyces candidus TaxID=67283 RepID=A0A7X0HGH4_9ACTN|nr:hypothetical protein [Streptomyces candidus]
MPAPVSYRSPRLGARRRNGGHAHDAGSEFRHSSTVRSAPPSPCYRGRCLHLASTAGIAHLIAV